MWRGIFIGLLLIAAGCVAPQPASNRTVAAYEVPLHTASDRSEFLALVRQEALAEGLHLDASTDGQLRDMADAIPQGRMTVHAAVWRGLEDNHSEATIMDRHDHPGLVWIAFAQGEDIELATRFRDRLMVRILDRWPETLALPVMPTGAIPLHGHLIKTPSGYKLDPAYVSSYEADPSSPLVAQPAAD
jgi:hypothetical protein